ncbi:hypothetical protein [Marinobacterium jannaschii]|uniref:hypothetical protein n=1 Tax=Marinobacterium jannaschii TaxID=64970 RepID=UPI00048510A2|nr:hypothetical protein [Marinobacterium jannaschii]
MRRVKFKFICRNWIFTFLAFVVAGQGLVALWMVLSKLSETAYTVMDLELMIILGGAAIACMYPAAGRVLMEHSVRMVVPCGEALEELPEYRLVYWLKQQ